MGSSALDCTQHFRLWWEQPLTRPTLSVKRKADDSLSQSAAKAVSRADRLAKRTARRVSTQASEVAHGTYKKNRLELSRYQLLFANLWVSPATQMRIENVLVQHAVHDTIDLAQLSDAEFAVLHHKLDGGLFADRVHKVRCTLLLSQSQ